MRVVSLDPAWTEWAVEIGAEKFLVATSEAGDLPPSVLSLPAVAGLDFDAISSLEPDLILIGRGSDVDLARIAEVVRLDAVSFKQVLDTVLRLASRLGVMSAAMSRIAARETRLRQLRERLGLNRGEGLQTVVCLTALDPPTAGGWWIPDIVALAGGRPLLVRSGEPPRAVTQDEIREAAPDVLGITNLAPPGLTATRMVLFDGLRYFIRPSPRLYRSVELMAEALHPGSLAVDPSEMRVISGRPTGG